VAYPPRRTLLQLLLERGDESAAVEAEIRSWLGARVPVRALMQGGVLRLMPYVIDVK
jgi:hypothetical protein